MNVHFSYKSSKSPEIEHEIQNQIQKLGKRLQAFRPELVHLHGGFEKNGDHAATAVSLNLRLPSGQLNAHEMGANGIVALKAAFHELTAQLNAHKDLLRNRYKWRRNSKEKRSVPFESTLAALQPISATDGEIHSFINANLPKLNRFIVRELQYREVNGFLSPDTIVPEEILGEAVALALGDEEERPASLGLEAWLYKLARRAILNAVNENDGEAHAVHFEQPVWSPNVSGSDEEYLQLETVLKSAKPPEREAFILFAIEGFTIEEIARISDKNGDEVRQFIESAKDLVGKKLPGNERLKEKLLKQKLA